MKPVLPAGPAPETGRKYWRSLDQLADAPAFREWVEREFPARTGEFTDALTRRHFFKLMSASFLLAGVGLTGCRRPVENIYPFAKMPEDYVHGVPRYYATSMPVRGSALPLLAESNDGRPTKVEGNPQHPQSHGGTDHFAQASVLNLYDPDRAQRFTHNGNDVTRGAALDFLAQLSRQLPVNGGQGLAVLMERSSSPSRARLQSLISEKLPQARWFVYEPVDFNIHRQAATLTHSGAPPADSHSPGLSLAPYYQIDQARVIVSLDADFIGQEEDNHRHIHGFAQGRKLTQPTDSMNRLYAVEGLMTLTGANADHRLRVPTRAVGLVAAHLAQEVLRQKNVPESAAFLAALRPVADDQTLHALSQRLSTEDTAWAGKWISECAKDLLAHQGKSLIIAGHRQPLGVHILAWALNTALGNTGSTVQLLEMPEPHCGTLPELARALKSSAVDTLVVLGGNPVYNAPADLDWAKTQRLAKTVVRLGYYEDETFSASNWHFPAAHYLESWGDARTIDGTLGSIQPLIEPLFGGLTELEILARLGGVDAPSPYEIVRQTFKGLAPTGDFEAHWKRFLHDGFLANSAAKPATARFEWTAAAQALSTAPVILPNRQQIEVVFHRDYSLDDGRYNNNGWLQEMPDPITKLTWDNAVLISRATASELGLQNGDLVEIKLGERAVQGPIWIQPGLADYSLGLALGYGRTKAGRVGLKTGFNAYPLRTSVAEHFVVGASVRKLGQTYSLSCTQDHWSMEGRSIIREANLSHYAAQPDFAKEMDRETPPSERPLYPNPLQGLAQKALEQRGIVHQWGMSIDLNACVGCAACVIACQSENNIPIVGKEQVKNGREMHWIRIDRYYAGDAAKEKDHHVLARDGEQQREQWIDDPQVVNQPMLCQHCEAAPCENVCPVNATVHDDEGLNVMVYNRCVGTRYCSNNCPYKVRRFNFFDYHKRPIQDHQLYRGPLAKKPADEWELMKLVKNPDVTVRMRGVMEKCTFCLQRIEQAKINQKIKAGASGDVAVPDGAIQTACQQACPAEAIVFGNVADPNSRVSRLKALGRNYSVLEFLNTKPRTTYLARVRNPNPLMPDYYARPFSADEYWRAYQAAEGASHPPEGGAISHGESSEPSAKGGRP